MKVIETTEFYGEEGASKITVELICDNGEKESVGFGEGELEDMYLFRDLSDAYSLVDFAKLAYEAGKRGESFDLEQISEGEDD